MTNTADNSPSSNDPLPNNGGDNGDVQKPRITIAEVRRQSHEIFERVSAILEGLRLKPIGKTVEAFIGEYPLNVDKLKTDYDDIYKKVNQALGAQNDHIKKLSDELRKRRAEVEDLQSQAEQLRIHNDVIPEASLTQEHRDTFERIMRITGEKIPTEQWTYQIYEICTDMLEKLYVRDPLTDLLSTHSFNERLGTILSERKDFQDAGKTPPPCTVVVCDLNHFKSYNSNIQYAQTDEVLKKIAIVLREEANKLVPYDKAESAEEKKTAQEDLLPVARLNTAGDEFVMIMPCSGKEAEERLKAINKTLSKKVATFRNREGDPTIQVRNMTMSYGCYELDSDIKPERPDSAISAMHKATTKMQFYKDKIKKEFNKVKQPLDTAIEELSLFKAKAEAAPAENQELTKAFSEKIKRMEADIKSYQEALTKVHDTEPKFYFHSPKGPWTDEDAADYIHRPDPTALPKPSTSDQIDIPDEPRPRGASRSLPARP